MPCPVVSYIGPSHHPNTTTDALNPPHTPPRTTNKTGHSTAGIGVSPVRPRNENVLMQTEGQELLQALVDRGWLSTVPPGQDDDLTMLHVAMEEVRVLWMCMCVCGCLPGGGEGEDGVGVDKYTPPHPPQT